MSELFSSMGVTPRDRQPTYDELYMQSLTEMNRSTQEMVNRLPYVHSLGFKKSQTNVPGGVELVDIPSSFFDEMNGLSNL